MRHPAHHPPTTIARGRGFSLIELLAVASIVSLLLVIAAPSFVSLNPSRKTGIHELAGFLENARAEAIARRTPRVVAFADETFPGDTGALRAYALFEIEEPESDGVPPRFRRLSPWRQLPEGIVFARSGSFEVAEGGAFRTLHDLAEKASFPVPGPGGAENATAALPYLVFGPDGGVRAPRFHHADALHLGLVEGFFDPSTTRVVYTAKRTSRSGRVLPNGECLEIGFYTGRTRLLTD